MKWTTRERIKVGRVACQWLIRKFVYPDAEFIFVPADPIATVAEPERAIPCDLSGGEGTAATLPEPNADL
jgi:hypothetical protein